MEHPRKRTAGRIRYVELHIKKPKANGTAAKQAAIRKPCEKMTDAIVMYGGNRGQIVKVCADPNCKTHHGDKPSPEQSQRDRALERKRIEKGKIVVTARHRILATILERASVPIKKSRPDHDCAKFCGGDREMASTLATSRSGVVAT